MALVLGVKKDGDVFVGNYVFRVMKIYDNVTFTISVRELGSDVSTEFLIDSAGVYINPKIHINAGIGYHTLARVMITAPDSIRISKHMFWQVTPLVEKKWEKIAPDSTIESLIGFAKKAKRCKGTKTAYRYGDLFFTIAQKRIEVIEVLQGKDFCSKCCGMDSNCECKGRCLNVF